MPAGGDVPENPSTSGSDDTKGHGKQARLQGIKAEIIDDDRAEGDKSTVGDVDDDVENKDDPDLDVQQGLPDLLPLPHLVVDAGPVDSQALCRVILLFLREEASIHRVIRKNEEKEYTVEYIGNPGDDV